MKYTNSIHFDFIYNLFDAVTPLAADCGTVCGHACCRNAAPEDGGETGMRLVPGEEDYRARRGLDARLGAARTDSGLLVCGGRCVRDGRPLACRMFPLFPYVGPDGLIRAAYDPRAWRVCPLVRYRERIPLMREFVRAVRTAGRALAAEAGGRDWLRGVSREIDEFNRLLRLDEGRGPICRRERKTGDV